MFNNVILGLSLMTASLGARTNNHACSDRMVAGESGHALSAAGVSVLGLGLISAQRSLANLVQNTSEHNLRRLLRSEYRTSIIFPTFRYSAADYELGERFIRAIARKNILIPAIGGFALAEGGRVFYSLRFLELVRHAVVEVENGQRHGALERLREIFNGAMFSSPRLPMLSAYSKIGRLRDNYAKMLGQPLSDIEFDEAFESLVSHGAICGFVTKARLFKGIIHYRLSNFSGSRSAP